MAKLRLLPIVLTVMITVAVFFGGWFAYQQWYVKKNIDVEIAAIPGVEEAVADLGRNEVLIGLKLEHAADLQKVYPEARRIAESVAGSRTVRIDIVQEPSETLDDLWSAALFDVAEAMENRRYGDIPACLNELAEGRDDLTISTGMDGMNVYVRLSDGNTSKFVVLPRTPPVMEAWNDDSL